MKLFTKQKKLVILLILCMGLGFAYLSSGLDIKMNTKLVANSWDVYFDNIQVIDGSVSATTPTITNKTTVDYSVTFEKPGDYYEFTVDAVNDGTIDVMVESITMTQLENSYLRYIHYKITYDEEDEEIEIKQRMFLKQKEELLIKF